LGEDLGRIKNMSNFSPKLEDATDEQLMYMINKLDPRYATLASDELTRRTVKKLEKAIRVFNDQSLIQTEKLIKLTWGIIGLTIVMALGLVIQIILTLY